MGTEPTLANGASVWGAITNFDTQNARRNLHFSSLSIPGPDGWFHLARYHDVDADENGPAALARLLKVEIRDVFPISYDLSQHVKGDANILKGSILAEPTERLTRDEIISLAVV